MDDLRILNQKALAHLLGIDRKTLYRWHERKIGPPRVLVKKRYYYVMVNVSKWLESINDYSIRALALPEPLLSRDQPSPIGQSHSLESVL